MAILKGDLQDDLGNVLYPNTSIDLVEGLADKLNALNNDRGYLDTKEYTGNLNVLMSNGIYSATSSAQNKPIASADRFTVYVVKDGNSVNQIAMCSYSVAFANSNKIFSRTMIDGGWSSWRELATTTKTPFSLTANIGVIVEQNCFSLGGMTQIRATINGTFTAGAQYLIAKLPSNLGVSAKTPLSCVLSDGNTTKYSGICFATGVEIYFVPTTSGVSVSIGGVL